jgi:hypothetical protein
MSLPTFAAARDYVFPFGQYRGKTLDEIATTDKGLLYLDWVYGQMADGTAMDNVRVYLADPTISRDIQRLLSE